MPNPVWPPGLLQDFFLGLNMQRQPAVARFTNDAGPAATRRIFGNATSVVTAPIFATMSERILIDQFFAETLEEGALPFDFIDPVTTLPVTFRFLEPISWSHGRAAGDEGLFSAGQMKLERMP